MFENTHTIFIKVKPEKVWDYLICFERWWLFSNPDHIEMEILSPQQEIRVGTRFKIIKGFAGLKGEVFGEIRHLKRKQEMVWTGKGKYKFLGVTFYIREGFSWHLTGVGNGTTFKTQFWAEFPRTLRGRMGEAFFTKLSKRIEKDFGQTRHELLFIKQQLEENTRNLWVL